MGVQTRDQDRAWNLLLELGDCPGCLGGKASVSLQVLGRLDPGVCFLEPEPVRESSSRDVSELQTRDGPVTSPRKHLVPGGTFRIRGPKMVLLKRNRSILVPVCSFNSSVCGLLWNMSSHEDTNPERRLVTDPCWEF